MNITYLDCTSNEHVEDSKDKKYDKYRLEELVLIRTTDIFPKDKIIETPIHGNAIDYASSTILGNAINNQLRKKYHSMKELLEEIKKYQVVYETKRTTIHFCINGLVSRHMQGNFDNKKFIIIEPLKYHIKDKSLLSLRAEDTYFNDDMYLSNEAALIIKEEEYDQLKNNEEYIKTLKQFNNIFVYKGNNEKMAVKKALELLGIDSLVINNHGYTNGLTNNTSAQVMYEYINNLREEYGINNKIHFYSELNQEESIQRQEQGRIIDLEHFFYIINNSNLPQNIIDKIKLLHNEDEKDIKEEHIDNYRRLESIANEIVQIIGLDKIEKLTKEFNNNYINSLHNKTK